MTDEYEALWQAESDADPMTDDELQALEQLESKMDQVRVAVSGVVNEFHTGLILHGEGGTGKSYTVERELKSLGCQYVHHNSRLTGRGLVDELQRKPTAIHFIEDAETLMDDKRAWGVLRSALWSQSKAKPMVRPIQWGAYQTAIRFEFTGGIIMVCNRQVSDDHDELRALKSRVRVLRLDVSGDEMKALMKQICASGYEFDGMSIGPKECFEVRQFVIDSLIAMNKPLNLRHLMLGFQDRVQYSYDDSRVHWKEMLRARMREKVVHQTRPEQNAEKHRIAMEVDAMDLSWADKCKLWHERTGLRPASLDRARKRPG